MFTHLHLHTPWSFLDGAAEPEAAARRAAELGMDALAITDHDSLAAAVKFAQACRGYGVRPIFGAEVTLTDRSHLTLLAADSTGYANLCSLISLGYAEGGRLSPALDPIHLAGRTQGLFCLTGCSRGRVPTLVRDHRYQQALDAARDLLALFGPDRLCIELQEDRHPESHRVCRELASLAHHLDVRAVATNNVHYVRREEYIGHDVLRCIAAGVTVDTPHPLRPLNSEQYLKSAAEMRELFAWMPEALEATRRIADQCGDPLPQGDVTPAYPVPEAHADAAAYLRHLAYKGAAARYRGISPAVRARLEHELEAITAFGYADYFLMVWQIVRWARSNGIRATGRGSAADSCVAYALTLTDVDVIRRDLPFARFLAPGKAPDIDMDFPSERRDDVFRCITERYGAEHVAMVCTFFTFWARSAVRDVGKALGLPADALKLLTEHLSGFVHADRIDEAFASCAELRPLLPMRARFRLLFSLCARIAGFPRHLGTHSSGVVISRVPLATLAPVTPSARGVMPICTLDKDDAEAIGFIKFDVLSLRMLSAINDGEKSIAAQHPEFRYEQIPMHDRATWATMHAGEAIGSFQFESPAQMALAAVLHPAHFEDLVASVALIRPGPIRGQGVRRFVDARTGWARAEILHPCLRQPLEKTYGVIVFQEQVVQVVAAMTGCSDAEADRFRKGLARHHRMGTMDDARRTFIDQARRRWPDFTPEAGETLFDQLAGWCGYGFTEGHAASFALTGWRTAYLTVHHPAAHFAGMMNQQPMGYYDSNTLASEARRRGVRILPVDINASADKCAADSHSIRLGFRLVAQMREQDVAAIAAAREAGPFGSLLDFAARVPLHRDRLENLVLCGAFDSLHPHRRGLLWRLDETVALAASWRRAAAGEGSLDLGPIHAIATPVAWEIDDFTLWDAFLWTWRICGVCPECHVFAHLRARLGLLGISTARDAMRARHGARMAVAGLNIRPHRPPTRSGNPVLFTSIEDETGFLQAVCVGEPLQQHTALFLTTPAVVVSGPMERRGSTAMMRIEEARPLRMADWIGPPDDEPAFPAAPEDRRAPAAAAEPEFLRVPMPPGR